MGKAREERRERGEQNGWNLICKKSSVVSKVKGGNWKELLHCIDWTYICGIVTSGMCWKPQKVDICPNLGFLLSAVANSPIPNWRVILRRYPTGVYENPTVSVVTCLTWTEIARFRVNPFDWFAREVLYSLTKRSLFGLRYDMCVVLVRVVFMLSWRMMEKSGKKENECVWSKIKSHRRQVEQ